MPVRDRTYASCATLPRKRHASALKIGVMVGCGTAGRTDSRRSNLSRAHLEGGTQRTERWELRGTLAAERPRKQRPACASMRAAARHAPAGGQVCLYRGHDCHAFEPLIRLRTGETCGRSALAVSGFDDGNIVAGSGYVPDNEADARNEGTCHGALAAATDTGGPGWNEERRARTWSGDGSEMYVKCQPWNCSGSSSK